jgi:hypothetical protein
MRKHKLLLSLHLSIALIGVCLFLKGGHRIKIRKVKKSHLAFSKVTASLGRIFVTTDTKSRKRSVAKHMRRDIIVEQNISQTSTFNLPQPMQTTHFEYKPILSDDELAKMVDGKGQIDAKAITNFYQKFLENCQ